MKSYSIYHSPIGEILITCENNSLIGLTFLDDNHTITTNITSNEIINKTTKWLDDYFSHIVPKTKLKISLENSTLFQQIVLEETLKIPYGEVVTYKELSKRVKERRHMENMSSQAIGQALKRNPIAIVIPCHRVVGKNNKITGYAFGVERKVFLLNLERNKINRCKWCNMNNPLYVKYHDEEWGALHLDDEKYLFEMLTLETFQAGLSWECVLNKRENFRKLFSNFSPEIIKSYTSDDIDNFIKDKGIIRNRLKIKAMITNANIFLDIQKEYGSFKNYLLSFSNNLILYEFDKTTNDLSDSISKDLKKRGMKFVGSTIIYSYLQAIGIINSHEKDCYLFKKK